MLKPGDLITPEVTTLIVFHDLGGDTPAKTADIEQGAIGLVVFSSNISSINGNQHLLTVWPGPVVGWTFTNFVRRVS